MHVIDEVLCKHLFRTSMLNLFSVPAVMIRSPICSCFMRINSLFIIKSLTQILYLWHLLLFFSQCGSIILYYTFISINNCLCFWKKNHNLHVRRLFSLTYEGHLGCSRFENEWPCFVRVLINCLLGALWHNRASVPHRSPDQPQWTIGLLWSPESHL